MSESSQIARKSSDEAPVSDLSTSAAFLAFSLPEASGPVLANFLSDASRKSAGIAQPSLVTGSNFAVCGTVGGGRSTTDASATVSVYGVAVAQGIEVAAPAVSEVAQGIEVAAPAVPDVAFGSGG